MSAEKAVEVGANLVALCKILIDVEAFGSRKRTFGLEVMALCTSRLE